MNKQFHPAIQVAAATEGFRRAGRIFGRDPQTIPLGDLSSQEHDSILADRSLVVMQTAVQLDAEQLEALPHRHAVHVKNAKVDVAPTSVSHDAAKAAADLASTKAYLESQAEELAAREKEITLQEADLAGRVAAVAAREADVAARADQLEQEAKGLESLAAEIEASRAQRDEKGQANVGKTALGQSKK